MHIGSQCFQCGCFGFFFSPGWKVGHSHSLKQEELHAGSPPALCKKYYMPYCTCKFLQRVWPPGSSYFAWTPGATRSQRAARCSTHSPGSVRPPHTTHLAVWVFILMLESGSPDSCTERGERHPKVSIWSLLTNREFLRGKLRNGCF